MITFKDAVETTEQIETIKPYMNEIARIETFYAKKDTIEKNIIHTTNKLIGKYFRENKKAQIPFAKGGSNIEISKSGIGNTPTYHAKIDLYNVLVSKDKNSDAFINQVIRNDAIRTKVKKHLSLHGKEIIDVIKKANDKFQIAPIDRINVSHGISLSPEEMMIFKVKKPEAYIKILDREEEIMVYMSRTKRIGENENSYDFDEDDEDGSTNIFQITKEDDSGRRNDEEFLKTLFVYNHKADFEAAINKYKEKSKEEFDKWEGFKEEFNKGTAKFTLLELIK